MDNIDRLIVNLLNVSVSDINSISSNVEDNVTFLYLTLKNSIHTCPFCGGNMIRSKGFYTKQLIIPNLPFHNTIIHQRVHRSFFSHAIILSAICVRWLLLDILFLIRLCFS